MQTHQQEHMVCAYTLTGNRKLGDVLSLYVNLTQATVILCNETSVEQCHHQAGLCVSLCDLCLIDD